MIESICPGCSIGCGLYVIKDGDRIDIDFRKRSPVNEGKLCKFGVQLPRFYSKEQAKPMIKEGDNQKEVESETAIEEAAKKLKEVRDGSGADSIAFVAGGLATNEELVSLKGLADALGCSNIECGLGKFSSIGSEAFKLGIPLEDVNNAKNIVMIFVDLHVQYPLLTRNLLKAKENGAKVLSIGTEENRAADRTVLVGPGEQTTKLQSLVRYLKDKSGDGDFDGVESFFEDSVIIADLNALSDVEIVKAICNINAQTNSRLLFMKPYANLSGAAMLEFTSKEGGIDGLLSEIDEGKIKALYILESDLVGTSLDEEKVIETLSKLDLLIVQNALKGATSDLADLLLPNDLFFGKRGSVINAEGRVLSNRGDGTSGIDVLGKIAEAAGGKKIDYEAAQAQVLETLGISEIDEDKIPLKRDEKKVEVDMGEAQTMAGEHFLVLKTNPFFWNGMVDKNVVELNISNVKRLGLCKGENISIKSNGSAESIKFKVSDLPENVVISEAKLSLAKELVSEIGLERLQSD
ncbi:MAG: molybdopterin-dependent oxidoreductase [Halobacteriota archaeon]|nr:molybdopterin-dependent oxidoreductase [Halobacteriota archaeon]